MSYRNISCRSITFNSIPYRNITCRSITFNITTRRSINLRSIKWKSITCWSIAFNSINCNVRGEVARSYSCKVYLANQTRLVQQLPNVINALTPIKEFWTKICQVEKWKSQTVGGGGAQSIWSVKDSVFRFSYFLNHSNAMRCNKFF